MYYGAEISVGEFIYKNEIPVTLGNIIGGAICTGSVFWFLYGRHTDSINSESTTTVKNSNLYRSSPMSEGTITARTSVNVDTRRQLPDPVNIV